MTMGPELPPPPPPPPPPQPVAAAARAARRVRSLAAHLAAAAAAQSRSDSLLRPRRASANDDGALEKADVEEAARILLAAWDASHAKVEAASVPTPTSLAQVYRVHDQIEALAGPDRVKGYKLGGVGAAPDESGNPCVAVSAPLLAETIKQESFSFSVSGFKLFLVEVEIAFVMAADLPAAEAPFAADRVWSAVGETRMALELVGSRFTDVAGAPALSKLADSICAGGVVLGAPIQVADPQDLVRTRARLYFDGQEVDQGDASACPAGSPLDALTWLANHLASRGKKLSAGDVVISGKICAAPGVAPYQRVSATFEGTGSIETFLLP